MTTDQDLRLVGTRSYTQQAAFDHGVRHTVGCKDPIVAMIGYYKNRTYLFKCEILENTCEYISSTPGNKVDLLFKNAELSYDKAENALSQVNKDRFSYPRVKSNIRL